jgi:thiol:disulfide interchange protein DsbD
MATGETIPTLTERPMTQTNRVRLPRCIGLALLLFALGPALGQAPGEEKAVKGKNLQLRWSLAPADPFSDANQAGKPVAFQRGSVVLLTITGTPEEGWHTYPIRKATPSQDTAQLSTLEFRSDSLVPIGSVLESEPALVDQGLGLGQAYEYEGTFTWSQEFLIRPTAPAGQTAGLTVDVRAQVCKNLCVENKLTLAVAVPLSAAAPLPLSAEDEKRIQEYDAQRAREVEKPRETAPTPAAPTPSVASWREYTIVDRTEAGGPTRPGGLWGTIITAILGGLISLLTPCVFPMIPVTVSFFLKRAEKEGHRAVTMAAVYCGTIIAVLTLGGMALVSVLQTVSQHYATNLFLTAVFIFFALSLLGMYEITLPSGLTRLTSSREGTSGLVGIVFMALTFSIISFACVGPIYGGFITLEAGQQSAVVSWLQRLLGPLAFAVAFAAPFFFLALFPSLLRSLPKSGSWMNAVKVVMGFLELAAAFKFVRAAELNWRGQAEYFTYDLVLGVYVVLCVACGLYLLGVYRLPHDHDAAETIGVSRLMFSLVFLTVGVYLMPGLLKDEKDRPQKPRGVIYEWVRSFLLPDEQSDWHADLPGALAEAERDKKLVFVDFTGLG